MGIIDKALSLFRAADRVERVVNSAEYRQEFNRRLSAKYDAAQTTMDNENHWANSDALGPNLAASASVRKTIRRRARYEALANNSYAKGMVLSFANQLIGTGPRLQLMTRDKLGNQRVEYAWQQWCEEVGLAEKLRTMANAYVVDGEPFGLFTTNNRLRHPVKLDVVPLEADYFDPWHTYDDRQDGADFDANNQPIRWYKWDEHPGEQRTISGLAAKAVDASQVLHIHRPERPGQRRGVSHLVSALPLFAMYRRFKLATVAAAETAASYAGVLYTTLTPEAAIPGNSSHWGAAIPIEHRAMMTLPEGWQLEQLEAKHPATTLAMFEERIISEVARCMLMPLNIAIGSSKDHNFSSGKLDHLGWDKAIQVERSRWVCRIVNRIVSAWLDEAALIPGLLPSGVGPIGEWKYQYRWDSAGTIDEAKQATADAANLANGTTTRTAIYARLGLDIDSEDEIAAAENGVSVAEYRRGLWEARTGASEKTAPDTNNEEAADDAEQVAETAAQ